MNPRTLCNFIIRVVLENNNRRRKIMVFHTAENRSQSYVYLLVHSYL